MRRLCPIHSARCPIMALRLIQRSATHASRMPCLRATAITARPLCAAAFNKRPFSTTPSLQAQGIGFDTSWPVSSANTILNVCPQGERMVIERFGSLNRIVDSGLFWTIPLVDQISFRVDMRERTIRYPPQLAITKDNVSVEVSAVVFMKFVNVQAACYGASNPLVAVMELAKSAMRSRIGEIELDDLFHSRASVNDQVRAVISEAAPNWGLVVTRHEILDVQPDARISEAMDRQAAAERARRERVLQAEGEKEVVRLESEGMRIQSENESEGDRIRARNKALAEAEATRLKADATASAIDTIADALEKKNGREAASLALASEYIDMYGEMGAKSNTLMVGDNPADVRSLMAQAARAFDVAKKAS